jgi:Golgi nucleoside diphosphatase
MQQIPYAQPNYRRLRYVRYADDALFGFIGSKDEAEEIEHRLKVFLRNELDSNYPRRKTLITHATTETAKFLGYEYCFSRRHQQTGVVTAVSTAKSD